MISPSSATSVSPSERASSDVATVGDEGTTSALKYEGAGDDGGVKNHSSWAMIPSAEGDVRQGGIGIGNNEDEDIGDGVVTRSGVRARGVFRKMCRCIGSSPLNTARGMG